MLNFDEPRFIGIQSGAVALADPVDRIVSTAIAAGADRLVLLGTGGAGILMLPAAHLLQARSAFPVQVPNPAELVLTGSPVVGPTSLVVIPSLSGTTPESLAALDFCQAAGARVVTLTAHGDSPLAKGADEALVNFAEDDTSSESFYLQSLLFALSLMRHTGELDEQTYRTTVSELAALPSALIEVKRGFEPAAAELAADLAARPWHIVSGAGSTWAQAFYYGMCILEEMQWIRTRPVHASDFFHGTLELVEAGTSLLLLKGEDVASRALVERVERFATTLTDQVHVLDAANAPLPGVNGPTRALVSPIVLATMLERVSAHLEVLRDHPLTTRRYYRRLDY